MFIYRTERRSTPMKQGMQIKRRFIIEENDKRTELSYYDKKISVLAPLIIIQEFGKCAHQSELMVD